jgi:hypothetical protein
MTMAGTSNSRGKGFKDALSAAGVNEEVQTALTSAFEAMCDWRQDAANQAERHGNKVFDKMGAAAKAMGWPAELVDMTRQQMQQASKMQIQVLDQVMDAGSSRSRIPEQGLACRAAWGRPSSSRTWVKCRACQPCSI